MSWERRSDDTSVERLADAPPDRGDPEVRTDGSGAPGRSRPGPVPVDAPDPDAVPDVDVLVVDNYDSFAYNLVQYVGELAGDVTVRRNDAVDVADVRALAPDGVVVSPGPGRPEDAGVSTALFEEPDLPILGVCLGHQALCAVHGAPVERAPAVVHGKPSIVRHDRAGIFAGLPEPLRVGRYHSLAVRREALPDALVETARTVAGSAAAGDVADADASGDSLPEREGAPADSPADERSILMGVRHRERPHVGVQFHPESILTGQPGEREGSLAVGKRLVAAFCELVAEVRDGERTPERGEES